MLQSEFISLFKHQKIMVHVHSQNEKTLALSYIKQAIYPKDNYNLPFDYDYQYIGSDGVGNIVGWNSPKATNAQSIEYDELCSIMECNEDSMDTQFILSFL